MGLMIHPEKVNDKTAEAVLEGLHAVNVVEVAVREQDGLGGQVLLGEQVFEWLEIVGAVAAGIDDHAAAGFAPGHVAALLEEVTVEGTDIEHFFASFAWQNYKTYVKFV